ncbi:hypothetical protein C2G38_2119704 [Gigaspora rosea]|uniref:Uncharacterized protein n=1 Tax=Gigaspora rosea TaxID=44941 RepID=A0A397U3W6_9GLOM|nr:hypothetical protein C2G38_2119704 [Gigaspora rosea]
MIFYTKNVGVACYLSNNLDDLKNNSYPCIGLRSQDASVEANFGHKKLNASVEANFGRKKLSKFLFNIKFWCIIKIFNNDNVSLWIAKVNDIDKLKNKSNDTFALMSQGKAYYCR